MVATNALCGRSMKICFFFNREMSWPSPLVGLGGPRTLRADLSRVLQSASFTYKDNVSSHFCCLRNFVYFITPLSRERTTQQTFAAGNFMIMYGRKTPLEKDFFNGIF